MRAKYISFIFMLITTSWICSINDIYIKFEKGSALTKEILALADQLVITDNFIILLFNNSDDVFTYDPHLLFYNRHLKLESASFFPAIQLDSVVGHNIYGELNPVKYDSKESYRSDLPKGYQIILTPAKITGSSYATANKAIDKILLDTNNMKIKLFVKVANNSSVGLERNLIEQDSIWIKEFSKNDTLTFSFCEIFISEERDYIEYSVVDINGHTENDLMRIPEKKILNEYYDQIWSYLNYVFINNKKTKY